MQGADTTMIARMVLQKQKMKWSNVHLETLYQWYSVKENFAFYTNILFTFKLILTHDIKSDDLDTDSYKKLYE